MANEKKEHGYIRLVVRRLYRKKEGVHTSIMIASTNSTPLCNFLDWFDSDLKGIELDCNINICTAKKSKRKKNLEGFFFFFFFYGHNTCFEFDYQENLIKSE